MPFPSAEHVLYDNNPLDNVICQVRFPTILRIDSETPYAIQERLSGEYIHFNESQAVPFNIKLGGKPLMPGDDLGEMSPSSSKAYEFATDDEKWKISLTRNFIALSTTEYKRWGEFRERLDVALKAFIEVYKPVIFTRIGLRYIDVIVRSKLGLDDVDWTELITQPILGILASDVKKSVNDSQSAFLLDLKDNPGVVRVKAGTVKAAQLGEICFMVDSDYFDASKTKPEDVLPKVDLFHSKAFNLFRWCITDKLHEAMKPRESK